MKDREKVIDDLEEQIAWIRDNDFHKFPGWGHATLAMRDALALLKAQEPRVLALEEIHRGMAVWLEDMDKADMILAIGGASAGGVKCFITEKDMSITPKDADYGIRWRAWTQKPTDEQMEAVKWDGTD